MSREIYNYKKKQQLLFARKPRKRERVREKAKRPLTETEVIKNQSYINFISRSFI